MASLHTNQPEEAETLVSWKEIASFFNRAERTVKRWEQERALPVHRIPGGERGGVFAYPSELRSWLLRDQEAAAVLPSIEDDRGEGNENSALSADGKLQEIAEVLPNPPSERPYEGPVHRRSESRRWLGRVAATVVISGVTAAGLFIFLHYRDLAYARSSTAAAVSSGSRHVGSRRAEDLYLEGRYQWSLRNPDSLAKSIDAYTQAIVEDPAYAEAYAGLAESYDLLPEYGRVAPAETFARAKAAADRAIALNPGLAAGHRARAFALFYGDWDVAGSDAEFRRALALDPTEVDTHHWYATTLLSRLEGARAMAQIDEALRLSPTTPAIVADAAFIHGFFHNNRAASIKTLKELAQTQPSLVKPRRYLAEFDLDDGNYPAYVADLRSWAAISHDPDELALADAAARGWAHGGKKGLFEGIRKEQEAAFARGAESGYWVGRAYLRLGQPKEALPYFKAALAGNDFALMTLSACDCISGLHEDPEYASLLRDVHARMRVAPVAPTVYAAVDKPALADRPR